MPVPESISSQRFSVLHYSHADLATRAWTMAESNEQEGRVENKDAASLGYQFKNRRPSSELGGV